ncbi:MAG: hypothetical protein ACXABY_10065 [Candidatus Thorarchaeota archaeon]|jgi:hypothetical protein
MARSGSYDFSINRDAIINGAFRQIGVLGESQTASTTRISQASQQLNLLIDQWEYQGVGLWLNKEVVLFPAKDQIKYYFGATAISGQSDYACLASEYTKTELSAAVTASGTTYTVDSISLSQLARLLLLLLTGMYMVLLMLCSGRLKSLERSAGTIRQRITLILQ